MKKSERQKIVKYSVGGLLGIFILAISLEFLGLGWSSYFNPKKESVKREVFEQTKSYTQGMAQTLAKHYREYQKGSLEDKKIITNVIQTQFAEFDEDALNSPKLKQFLINTRGY